MKCEQCGKSHKRKRFCSDKCKDRYHNQHNPRGIAAKSKFDREEDMHEAAMAGAAQGWDEGGWLA